MGSHVPYNTNVPGHLTVYERNKMSCLLTDADATVKVEAKWADDRYNNAKVSAINSVAAGAETLTWDGADTDSPTLVIAKAATSTVTQIVTAAGGVTGTPWGTLTAVGSGSAAVPEEVAVTPVSELPGYVAGYLTNERQ